MTWIDLQAAGNAELKALLTAAEAERDGLLTLLRETVEGRDNSEEAAQVAIAERDRALADAAEGRRLFKQWRELPISSRLASQFTTLKEWAAK